MRAAELDGRRVGLVGFGREGQAALAWLAAEAPGAIPVVFDERPDAQVPEGIERHLGPLASLPLADCPVLVRSPGISCYRKPLMQARDDGVIVTSGTSLWFSRPRSHPVLAITGTKGKSTVSALAAHLLEATGRRVSLAGNIGVPILEAGTGSVDVTVLELSSYQVTDLVGDPDVALVTNLYPEHLDWHGGEENYYRDKTRLLDLARGAALVNAACERSQVLTRSIHHRRLFNAVGGWRITREGIYRDQERLAGRPAWRLRGRHNDVNLAAALAGIDALGIDPLPGLDALARFAGLPHRQQTVHATGGLRFVDDSLATTPHATIAALDAFSAEPVAVIVGGHDRGLDWHSFAERLAREPVAAVIVRGDNRERIIEALTAVPGQPVREVETLADAVAAATAALAGTGTVLLSPGAPSFGEFTDYRERGEAFRQLSLER